jgi:Sugar-transfer associated ATP-grasp
VNLNSVKIQTFRRSLNRLWRSLPYDGQGLFSSADAALGSLRLQAASHFWKRVPWWSRPVLIPVARLGWFIACIIRTREFARAEKIPRRPAFRLFIDCLRSGANPNEALVWRQFFRPSSPHPLPGRAVARLLSQLGSATERDLLSDKQATAEVLARAGLPVPPLLDIMRSGHAIDPSGQAWSRPGQLFLKPRYGSGARGAMAVDVVASGVYRIDGGPPTGVDSLLDRLARVDDLLIQTRLNAAPEMDDLATFGAAPVLRLTTARSPAGTPFFHSGLLSINAPGERPRNFIRGQIRVPVCIATGCMALGIWFRYPGQFYRHLPWNGAPLADRAVPELGHAVEMALQAMSLFPGLPLVNWDLIITASGPVILEGNTAGDWILTNFSSVQGIETQPLAPLLRRWSCVSIPPQCSG